MKSSTNFLIFALFLFTMNCAEDNLQNQETMLTPETQTQAVNPDSQGENQGDGAVENDKDQGDESSEDQISNKWKEDVDEKKDVAILTDDNFDEFLEKYPKLFVKFYTNWCGHCIGMKKEFEELASDLKSSKDGEDAIAVAKVNAEENPKLVKRFDVKAYPDLKFFKDGQIVKYSAKARDKDTMRYFLRMRMEYSTNLIENEEDYELVLSDHFSVVLYLPESDKDGLKLYQDLALSYSKIPFSHVHDLSLIEDFTYEESYGLMLFKKFDEGDVHIGANKMFSFEEMKEFLEKHRFPKVYEFNNEAVNVIFEKESTSVFLFAKDFETDFVKEFREVASENQKNFYFALSHPDSGFGKRLAEFVSVKPEDTPCLRILNLKNQTLEKYKIESVSKKGLEEGIKMYLAGNLEQYFNSEPIPQENTKEVKDIVGLNFEEMVLKNTNQHVFVLLHAPWNGYSKKFFPIYEKFANACKGESDILLTKMDATQNEYKDLDVKSLPVLYLYKKDDKQNPVVFTKERKIEHLIKFLKEETGIIVEEETLVTDDL